MGVRGSAQDKRLEKPMFLKRPHVQMMFYIVFLFSFKNRDFGRRVLRA